MVSPSFVLYGPEYSSEYKNKSLVNIIIDSLKNHGNREAFIDCETGEILTHEAILVKSIKVANALKQIGLRKDDIVGIISENHINYWIPVLACLFNGIVIHHLSPIYTNQELDHLYNLSKPKILFCSSATLPQALWSKKEYDFIKGIILLEPSLNKAIVDLNILSSFCSISIDDFKPEMVNGKEQVAAINNSSGTTGLSKGVMITHDNLRSMLLYESHPEYFNLSTEVITIGNLPFSHAFGQLLALGTIVLGMKTIVMPTIKYDKYLSLIEKYKVTNLYLVPPIALFLAKNKIVDNYNMDSIKDIICGAAPLGKDIQQLLNNRLKVNVRQLYGMTEFTGIVTICPFSRNKEAKNGSIGVLIPGCMGKVKDITTNKSLGPNKSGELCFKGAFTCLGYVNNDTATTQLIDEEGFIHSGDIGYYDIGGNFYIVDRLKEMIKYKGFQVAPAEIENLLTAHIEVKDAAVIGIPNINAGEVPLAFVVRQPNSRITEEEVMIYVAAQVSIPKQLHGGVMFIEEIPKNPTGKILRRKLRDFYKNRII